MLGKLDDTAKDPVLRLFRRTGKGDLGRVDVAAQTSSPERGRHRGDPDLTRHVLAASPKPVGEGWRFVKPKLRSGVIDGAIALAMAVSIAGDIGEPPEAMLAFT